MRSAVLSFEARGVFWLFKHREPCLRSLACDAYQVLTCRWVNRRALERIELTSKSTVTMLRQRQKERSLILFDPILVRGEIRRRHLWLRPSLANWVNTQGVGKEGRFFDDVRAFLKSFVTGEDFDDDVKLKELKTRTGGWYEFRITFNPQTRIFGGFLRQGEFVALLQQNRERLGREAFAPSVDRTIQIWNGLFPGVQPLTLPRDFLLEEYSDDTNR